MIEPVSVLQDEIKNKEAEECEVAEADVNIEIDENIDKLNDISSISNKIDYYNSSNKKSKNLENNFRDISGISQNSNFIIKNSIQNSIFNAYDNVESGKVEEDGEPTLEKDFNLNLKIHSKILLNETINNKINEEKRLGEHFFNVKFILKFLANFKCQLRGRNCATGRDNSNERSANF